MGKVADFVEGTVKLAKAIIDCPSDQRIKLVDPESLEGVKGLIEPESNGDAKTPVAYTDITIIFDRSGSMHCLQEAVIKGFNDYVLEMRRTPGDTRWTMVQFDDPHTALGAKESFPNVVFEFKRETEVPLLTPENYVPRGWTALVDAVCKTVENVELRTSGKQDFVKPIVMIVTDGLENSSSLYTSKQMQGMIDRTTAKGFTYLYLGANQDAFAEANKHGIDHQNWTKADGSCAVPGLARGSSPVFNFDATPDGMRMAMSSGLIGCAHMASGCVVTGKLNKVV